MGSCVFKRWDCAALVHESGLVMHCFAMLYVSGPSLVMLNLGLQRISVLGFLDRERDGTLCAFDFGWLDFHRPDLQTGGTESEKERESGDDPKLSKRRGFVTVCRQGRLPGAPVCPCVALVGPDLAGFRGPMEHQPASWILASCGFLASQFWGQNFWEQRVEILRFELQQRFALEASDLTGVEPCLIMMGLAGIFKRIK